MRWLDRLERHLGSWAIPQFPLFIVVANGIIYLLGQVEPAFPARLTLQPEAVMAGEWWRVFTFLFVPPPMGPLWLALWLYLIYQYALTLEHEWSEFKFCFFYLLGAAATAVTSLWIIQEPLGNLALNTTLFLAFATLYPNFQLLLFFVLPVRVKFLAWFIWLMTAWSLFAGDGPTRAGILSSLFNYALFFGPEIWAGLQLRVEVYRNRRRFRG